MLENWGMTKMPNNNGEKQENLCCQWLTVELQTQIAWQKNDFMTMMGIYFNYAKYILINDSLHNQIAELLSCWE